MSKWYKNKWQGKGDAIIAETAEALQLIYDALNEGQQKKLVKDEKVKNLLKHYGVI